MKVFLSHSSSDKALVESVYNALEKDTAWLDRAEIEWGDLFIDKITEGIENASDFLIFWSASAKKSEWVRLELNMAFIRMLSERAIRLKVLVLDKTELPIYLKPYHFIDVSGSNDPVREVIDKLKPAIGEPVRAQRHRFLNRNHEFERIELAIDDSNTAIICVTGFQGVGKSSVAGEAMRRFFEGSSVITIEVTGGTDLVELALKVNAYARKIYLNDGLSKSQLQNELALGIEAISRDGCFLILKNVQHWLDEDARPISPLVELLAIINKVPAFKDRPVFMTSTRRIDIAPDEAGLVTPVFLDGLDEKHIATLIRLWCQITDGAEISPGDSLLVAKELYGHPVAAKLAAGLVGQYGVKFLQESPNPIVKLRRDLARYLISEVSLSKNTKLLMEFLSIVRKALPARVIFKALGITEEDFHQSVKQASQLGFLMHGSALEAHPLLLDYFWRSSWAREDYKPFATKLAETVWEYTRQLDIHSADYCELLTVCVRLFALAGKVDDALKIRRDLMGEIGQAAVDHYNRRNYELSEQMIDLVLVDDPKHWRMRLYKARICIRDDRYGEADKILTDMLSERPGDKGVMHAVGWRYLRAKKYEKALEQFSKVIAMADHIRSLRDGAECLHRLGRNDEALHFLARAKKIESENPYVLDLEARIYEENGDFGLAYESASIAVIRNPVDWSLQHRIGRILMALGREGEAIRYFEKSVELSPNIFTPRSSLIDAMLDKHVDANQIRYQIEEAKRVARTPRESGVVDNLEARCFIVEGHLDKAAELLERGLAKQVNIVQNSSLLAGVMFKLYAREKDEYPASAYTYIKRARIAIMQGLQQDPEDNKLKEYLERVSCELEKQ